MWNLLRLGVQLGVVAYIKKPSLAFGGHQAKEGRKNHRPRMASNIILSGRCRNKTQRKTGIPNSRPCEWLIYAPKDLVSHGSAVRVRTSRWKAGKR
jgi:hypothetical protein